VRDYIAARVDELTAITPEVLDNVELALRDIFHGRTSHADIDVVKVATERMFTDRESNPPLDPISGQWHCVNPPDWIDFSYHSLNSSSTIIWVEASSTDDSPSGARPAIRHRIVGLK
jgi:hypothetical protein